MSVSQMVLGGSSREMSKARELDWRGQVGPGDGSGNGNGRETQRWAARASSGRDTGRWKGRCLRSLYYGDQHCQSTCPAGGGGGPCHTEIPKGLPLLSSPE